MSDLVLAGGTVVTAEGSFRADVGGRPARRSTRSASTCRATAPRWSTSPARA